MQWEKDNNMAYQLAQVNVARFRLPTDDPANADFMNALDQVNAIADVQPGFVWRFQGDGNNAIDIQAFDDPNIAVNMSVWADLDSLAAFAYRNEAHRLIMRRRREWFEQMEFYLVLWWVEEGAVPTVEEAKARLELLRRKGPSAEAFTFKQPFAAPGEKDIDPVLDECA
jgi:uncharacterized protein DUF3291